MIKRKLAKLRKSRSGCAFYGIVIYQGDLSELSFKLENDPVIAAVVNKKI